MRFGHPLQKPAQAPTGQPAFLGNPSPRGCKLWPVHILLFDSMIVQDVESRHKQLFCLLAIRSPYIHTTSEWKVAVEKYAARALVGIGAPLLMLKCIPRSDDNIQTLRNIFYDKAFFRVLIPSFCLSFLPLPHSQFRISHFSWSVVTGKISKLPSLILH